MYKSYSVIDKSHDLLSEGSGLKGFIRYATLAPNGHNTQPWKFTINGNKVQILPDLSRRTPVVDPDDHHLFISLGCALENFVLAALAHGKHCEVSVNIEGEINITLTQTKAKISELYDAIPFRQSTRAVFDGQAIAPAHLKLLEKAAKEEEVELILITDLSSISMITNFVIQANTIQLQDKAFVGELQSWIRFNPSEALKTNDGLSAQVTGNPSVPTWIAHKVFKYMLNEKSETKKLTEQMKSTRGVAIFIGDKADKQHWIKVGRSFERFALQATALDIRSAHINQPVEVASVRHNFAGWLGDSNKRPDLVIRFGYGDAVPMSLRRPVDEVIVD